MAAAKDGTGHGELVRSIILVDSNPLRALDLELLLKHAFGADTCIMVCDSVHQALNVASAPLLVLIDANLAPPGSEAATQLAAQSRARTLWIGEASAAAGNEHIWLRSPINIGTLLELARQLGTTSP
jgi:hypothetical protein